jgi:hypothetical protein
MKDGQNGKFMVGRGASAFDFAGTVTCLASKRGRLPAKA